MTRATKPAPVVPTPPVPPSPGPYTIEGENCGGGANILDARGNRIGHTTEVAEPGDRDNPRVSGPEALANARLFAAATDLLDALSMWVEDPVHCASASDRPAPRPDCDCWACERTRIARAAIAKATTEVRHG